MAGQSAMVAIRRAQIAQKIVDRILEERECVETEFRQPGRVPSFAIDDLLPAELANAIYDAFPPTEKMVLKKSIKELKYVGYQMDRYDSLLEDTIYAFQDPRVVELIAEITRIKKLIPDDHLYAGGISTMLQGHYLNPHLDNSHDYNGENYRVLNLLYYVTPEWRDEYGGHLELWDRGLGKPQRTLHSRFNRLVVMQTDEKSWHSVSRIVHSGNRSCVSNYYFSPEPAGKDSSYHVTSFRGFPDQKASDVLMRIDNGIRWVIRKLTGHALFNNPHRYKKK